MKRIVTLLLIMLITGCNGQQKKDEKIEEKQHKEIEPIEKSTVNKTYDEFGNLIKYDSVYVWSYSNMAGDSVRVNLDSIMDNFRFHFEGISPFKGNDYFGYFPEQDSLFMKDFFNEDYYFKNWEEEHNDIEDMMKQMDSMRNKYLKEMYPGLLESRGESTKKIEKTG